MQTKIIKIGNSAGMIIPAALLQRLNLKAGDKVNIQEYNGQIVISTTKPKYQLKELLAKCDLSAPMPSGIEQWDESQLVGNEQL